MKRLILWPAVLAGYLWANYAHAIDIEPLVLMSHSSDVLRGFPFKSGDSSESTDDYLGFGVTLGWRTIELDLTHGYKSQNCHYADTSHNCDWESGTKVQLRWYPFRKRGM